LERKLGKSFKDNLLTADEMRNEIVRLQKAGKKVVFTNGVFDILHVGHLTYLEEARNLGDILVVGVNSDASVKVNKGDKRPINSETSRAYVLLGTKFVDYTVIFDEKTPEKLLDILKPGIHVKGGDYKKEDLPETKVVEKNGGEVKILSFVDNISTTEIINKIIDRIRFINTPIKIARGRKFQFSAECNQCAFCAQYILLTTEIPIRYKPHGMRQYSVPRCLRQGRRFDTMTR